MEIIVRMDSTTRLITYSDGGLEIETLVPGIGWVSNNEAEISDHEINSNLRRAVGVLCDKIKEMVNCGVG